MLRQNPLNAESSTPRNLVIPTAGGILDDETLIELVENPSQPHAPALLKFDGHEPEIRSQIEHDGRLYVPLLIPSTVMRALRLPTGCAPDGPTTQLFTRLLNVFETFTDLADYPRISTVSFLFASWIPDLLPVPVTLFLWAPDPVAGVRVLTVLSSLCRLALGLSGADARDLRVLPDDLPATLLLFRPPSSRRSLEALGALGWPGFPTCRGGRLVATVGAKAIASETPLPDGAALCPMFVAHATTRRHPLPPLDKRTLEALAKEFLPQLLRYRLQRCKAIIGEKSAQTYSAGPPNSLITALEICFRNEPALTEAVSPLIEAAQNGTEVGRIDPRALLLATMRARCHEHGRDRLHVGEMALDLNAKIVANGGKFEVSDRLVGSLLRSLGLETRKLDRRGRGLVLDGTTRLRIHRLAHEYNAPGEAFAGCTECAQEQPPAT